MNKVLLSSLVMFAVSLSTFGQTPNFPSGFASTAGLTLNGSPSAVATSGTKLRLTDGVANEARSVFFSTPVNVQSFTNDFTFQITNTSQADGFTFTIQGIGPSAFGAPGGALGYGPNSTGTIPGIGNSIAVGFQLYSKQLAKEVSLMGDWTNGASPSLNPGSDTTASGVNLHNNSDVMKMHMTYDGTTLTWTLTDQTTKKSLPQQSLNIDLGSPASLFFPGGTAYVGFTAGTGYLTAVQDITSWTYTSPMIMPQVATPTFSPDKGTYATTQTVTISTTTGGATICYTTDGSTPTANGAGTCTHGTTYSAPVSVSANETLNAIGSESGFSDSSVGSAAYMIQATVMTPTFNPPAGIYNSAQSVTISTATVGATICYTTDASTPTANGAGTCTHGTTYSGTVSVSANETLNAIGSESGFSDSSVGSAPYTIQSSGGGGSPSFPSGFPSSGSGLTLNGGAAFSGTHLRLTDGGGTEGRSAFFGTLVNVQWFITDFNFQLTNPNLTNMADGLTFTIQSNSPTALGAPGGALGYGPTTGTPGIGNSVAVKFDLYNNAGEGTNSTGLFTNGKSPTVPATTISGGVSLHSGHVMSAHLAYDGMTLTLIITDTSTKASFGTTFGSPTSPLDIPGTVGGSSAYVGFTAGTGGLTATQDILTWTYNSVQPTAFTWPVSTPITYAPSNCGPANDYSFYCAETPIFGQYHTGIDVCPVSPGCQIGNPVSASSSGVVELALVVSATQPLCDGSQPIGYQVNPSSSNLGNVIVIAHPNGKFTLYGHLDCIWPNINSGSPVAAGTRIGNMGHSGNGQEDRTFLPHTHFEMKDRAVTGDPTNGGYSGYTSDLPDGYGYHDARIYINPFAPTPLTPPAAVKVVANSAQTVFTGPDTSFAALATVAPNQEFVAFATSGSWYQIYLPNDNAPVSGWVQGGASLVKTDPGAILLQVTGASSSGLTIQVGPASGTNLLSWDYTHQNCKPMAKIWNGQQYVSSGGQNGFNEFFLPSNYYFSSAQACPSGASPTPPPPGPSIGWATSTFLH